MENSEFSGFSLAFDKARSMHSLRRIVLGASNDGTACVGTITGIMPAMICMAVDWRLNIPRWQNRSGRCIQTRWAVCGMWDALIAIS